MTFRSSLLSLALAGTLVPGLAAAQSLGSGRALAPASADQVITDLAPADNAATSSVAAACTANQALDQTAAANFAVPNKPTGPAYGQSFTAPCDGTLTQVALFIQSLTNNDGARVYGTLQVFSGEGTGGALVASQPFALANPAGPFLAIYPLQISAPVTTGGVYTFFVRTTSDSTAVRGTQTAAGTAGPYAGGQLYESTDGTAATATAAPTADLTFQLTFNGTTASQASVFNGAGWRLLSLPVIGTPLQDLSKLNLVQGFISQYPDAGANVLQNYTGTGTGAGFTVTSNATTPAAAAFGPGRGRGFFWYFYDQDITPDTTSFGGGTSRSRELTGFTLTAKGRAQTTPFAIQAPQLNADGLYMLGNPFATPFAVADIDLNGAPGGPFGTIGTAFSTWDPAIVNYRNLFTVNPTTMASDYLAVWQGVFAQVSGGTTTPQFAFFPSPAPAAPPPFYGRTSPTPYVQLMLDGTSATGAETHDVAAYVRFTAGGLASWDADDASKLVLPPGVESSLIAPVGVDEFGNRARLAVNSFPATAASAVTVPVDFQSTVGGSFVISWAGADALPEGWSATLTDGTTTVDLRQTPSYAFTSNATDWTERFTLAILPRGAVAGEASPTALRVGTFAPNPAAGTSRLTFTADAAQAVRATVVDALGRTVAVLFDGTVAAGAETALTVEAGRLAPGTYVVRVAGETFAETRRLTVVR